MVVKVCIPTLERGNENIDEAKYWRYSSARDYLGKDGLLAVCRQW